MPRTVEELETANRDLLASLRRANVDLAATRKDLATTRAKLEARRLANRKYEIVESAISALEDYAGEAFIMNEVGELVTVETSVSEPGMLLADWVADAISKRPYWSSHASTLAAEQHRGARRVPSPSNPFTHEHWNMTEQSTLIRTDRAMAERLAAEAGTTIGGGRPAPVAA